MPKAINKLATPIMLISNRPGSYSNRWIKMTAPKGIIFYCAIVRQYVMKIAIPVFAVFTSGVITLIWFSHVVLRLVKSFAAAPPFY